MSGNGSLSSLLKYRFNKRASDKLSHNGSSNPATENGGNDADSVSPVGSRVESDGNDSF